MSGRCLGAEDVEAELGFQSQREIAAAAAAAVVVALGTLHCSAAVNSGNLQQHHPLLERYRSRPNRRQFEGCSPKSALFFAGVLASLSQLYYSFCC